MFLMKSWANLHETQPLAARIFENSITRNRISHAYLIQGERGTGKKSMATLFIMTLFCLEKEGLEPCQQCRMCRRILSGNHPDIHWIEPDGQSIKNSQIKHLRGELAFSSFESTRKIYIINKAHTLTVNAANRMLKFLEEPDSSVIALLLTDNGQRILSTIRSRCQLIEMRPLDERHFQQKLMKLNSATINKNNARLLSALTNNIDEAITLHNEKTIYILRDLIVQLIYLLMTNYEERYLFIHEKWFYEIKEKKTHEQGVQLLLLAFRDIMMAKVKNLHEPSFFQNDDILIEKAGGMFSTNRLLDQLTTILEAKQKLTDNVHPTLVMEQLVLKL